MPLDDRRFSDRINSVRESLLIDPVEAVIFLDMNNIRYLTGFTGSDGAFLLGRERALLLVDGRYTTQAGEQVGEANVFQYREKVEGIADRLSRWAIRTGAFEASATNVETYEKLKEQLPTLTLAPLSSEAVNIRMIKDDEEVGLLRAAAALASQSLHEILDIIRPGVRERDIALELEFRMRRNGAQGISFPSIVAGGENAALPHATPGNRELKHGDPIVIDYGAVLDGYHSDETCTFVVGEASPSFRKTYEVVKTAHDRAIAAVKEGVACSEIDRIARETLEEAGLGSYFVHTTGHGIGLDVHEPPKMSVASKTILEAGMVINIEPGVYLPGQWGIRIEDTVLVCRQDCEVITKTAKDLKIL